MNFNNFDESTLNFELQQASNDTYLKTYKVKSPIIKDTNLLSSFFEVSAYRDDLSFDTNFQVYENLSVKGSDRYEVIYHLLLYTSDDDDAGYGGDGVG